MRIETNDSFVKTILAVTSALVVTGISALVGTLWVISNSLAVIEAKMSGIATNSANIEVLKKVTTDHEYRIQWIELYPGNNKHRQARARGIAAPPDGWDSNGDADTGR